MTKSLKTGCNIVPLCHIMGRQFREWRCSPARVSVAIAAVIDVARSIVGPGPVSAKVLAERHALPARHLEPVLQALVRVGY